MFKRRKEATRSTQVSTDYPKHGSIVVEQARSVVSVSLHGLNAKQRDRVSYVLKETFGSMMIKQVDNDTLQVTWYLKNLNAQQLRQLVSEALLRNGQGIGAHISER